MRKRAGPPSPREEKENATGFQTIYTLFKVQLLGKTKEWISSSMGPPRLLQDRSPTPLPELHQRGFWTGMPKVAGPRAGSVRKSSHQSDLSTSKLLEKKKVLLFCVFWHCRRWLKAASSGHRDFLARHSRTASFSPLPVWLGPTPLSQRSNFLMLWQLLLLQVGSSKHRTQRRAAGVSSAPSCVSEPRRPAGTPAGGEAAALRCLRFL